MGGVAPLSFINSLPLAGLCKDLNFYLTYSHCHDMDAQKDEVLTNQSVCAIDSVGKIRCRKIVD